MQPDPAQQVKKQEQQQVLAEDLPAYLIKPQSFERFTYDAAGNRVSATDDDGTVNYHYDDDNRLINQGGSALNYDNDGNLIRQDSATGSIKYAYDAAGRLAKVTMPDGTSMAYDYDAYGRKIFAEETDWRYTQDGNDKYLTSQTTSYLYEGDKLLKEYTGQGDPLAEYYNVNGQVIARKMFGFHDRKTYGNEGNIRTRGGLLYYNYDATGNVMDLTDRLGQDVIKYRWDVFGGMFAGTLAPYSYMGITGKQYDPKTGLVFFGSRWYDPLAGRFTMPDSFMGQLSLPQTLNKYAYALNNPVRFLDPTGHDTIWGYDIEGTAFGITSGGQEFYGNQTGSWDNYGDFNPDGGTLGSGGTGSGGSSGGTSSGGGSSGGGSSGGGGGGGGSSYSPPPEGGNIQAPPVAYSTTDTSSLNSADETGTNATGMGDLLEQGNNSDQIDILKAGYTSEYQEIAQDTINYNNATAAASASSDYHTWSASVGDEVGGTGQITVDRNGNVYLGLGLNAGKSMTGFSVSSVSGTLNGTSSPTPEEIEDFLSDPSVNAAAGFGHSGGSVTMSLSGTGTATESGWYSPQIGANATYSVRLFRVPSWGW